jgi:hypothetical protein
MYRTRYSWAWYVFYDVLKSNDTVMVTVVIISTNIGTVVNEWHFTDNMSKKDMMFSFHLTPGGDIM